MLIFLFYNSPSIGLWTLRAQKSLRTVCGICPLVLYIVLYIEWVFNIYLSHDEMNSDLFIYFLLV